MFAYRKDRSTYLRRGDAERRRARWRATMLGAGAVAAVALVLMQDGPGSARAEGRADERPFYLSPVGFRVREERDHARNELEIARTQLHRLQRVVAYSEHYRVPAGLAGSIYDAALAEGLEPDLAFRVVKIESDFKERAVSSAGAVGLVQIMPATAAQLEPGITRERLFDRETNLRLGFRYLRGLIGQHKGDVKTALTVYNRGPVAVTAARQRGEDPSNGYERIVMRGYRGRGIID